MRWEAKAIFRKISIAAAFALTALSAAAAGAQEISYFRIGTGGIGGTYYPVGGIVAQAISNPPGSRPCEKGGSCGVPGLVAVVLSSHGSVANIDAIDSGQLESGFAQSDVAYWAHTGTGTYMKKGRIGNLRAIASLYPESIHLVARKGLGLRSVLDLKGMRVSLDEPGSGTLVDARLILAAFGLTEKDIKPHYVKPSPAIDMMRDGELDAFFIVAGYPTKAVADLASEVGAELVPIEGPEIDVLVKKYSFFSHTVIPNRTYEGVGETKTISVGAQWLVSAELDEELIYGITKALWNDITRGLLDSGHAAGAAITLETALDGIAIPLHPGAERYYREAGMLK